MSAAVIPGCLALGFALGWLLARSGFTFARVVARGTRGSDREARSAYLLAIAMIWVLLGFASLAGMTAGVRPPAAGLPAALIGGFASGAAMGVLGFCPLSLASGAGHLVPRAVIAFAGWTAGVVVCLRGPVAPLVERVRLADCAGAGAARLADLVGVPQWMLLMVIGVSGFAALLRVFVNVYPGIMEWPKAGAGLALVVCAGWVLAVLGGEKTGLNGVTAVSDLLDGRAGIGRPSLLVAVGVVAFGMARRIVRFRSRGRGCTIGEVMILAAAGFVLGAAGALAGGCPAAHALFGAGTLGVGSLAFVAAMWGGASLVGVRAGLQAAETSEAAEELPKKERGMDEMSGKDMVRRLWARDASLWHDDPGHQKAISARLGWLDAPRDLRGEAGGLVWFARDLKRDGFTHALVLGMGGSSLAPEVLRRIFGKSDAGLDVAVLDTTDPTAIREAENRAEPSRTLFIVSSKSGSTIEVTSLFNYFHSRAGRRGGRFAAITDPGTTLERLARDREFRRIFLNPPDIGGRYSALSYFGLVPAALAGVDTGRLLDSAILMMRRCVPGVPLKDNPGFVLGAMLGSSALAGRDKVTLVLDSALEPFGLWAEQLLAESTGKDGKGLIPVAGEPLGEPAAYGPDRVFVSLVLGDEGEEEVASRLDALEKDGHPVLRIRIEDLHDLGGEFFRWEFATAVAGAILRIDPFDQPNVAEAKDLTGALLKRLVAEGKLPDGIEDGGEEGISALLGSLRAGRDYLGLLAYLPFDARTDERIQDLRVRLRDRCRVATTFGYGPRYLHSTGQIHKGGPDSGAFIVVTCDHPRDIKVPGVPYTFGQLERAQALGDMAALEGRARRVVRLHLRSPERAEVARAINLIAAVAEISAPAGER